LKVSSLLCLATPETTAKKAGYPSLRLITCGGPFDQATGHYTDNIIVYAHLVSAGG
jgi:hypothetical protein